MLDSTRVDRVRRSSARRAARRRSSTTLWSWWIASARWCSWTGMPRSSTTLPRRPPTSARARGAGSGTPRSASSASSRVRPRTASSAFQKREVLDPLRRPLGVDLRARDAPHLLRVRAEEGVVEALAEVLRRPSPRTSRPRGARATCGCREYESAHSADSTRPSRADDVLRLQRVREVLAVVVDAREPRARRGSSSPSISSHSRWTCANFVKKRWPPRSKR